jgi:hypothetical protein
VNGIKKRRKYGYDDALAFPRAILLVMIIAEYLEKEAMERCTKGS